MILTSAQRRVLGFVACYSATTTYEDPVSDRAWETLSYLRDLGLIESLPVGFGCLRWTVTDRGRHVVGGPRGMIIASGI